MPRKTSEQRQQMQREALDRASNPRNIINMQMVIEAAAARGWDAEPGMNVLTFNAWKAKGRYVRKGEKALCKLPTMFTKTDDNGETKKIFASAAVFHINQTEAMN